MENSKKLPLIENHDYFKNTREAFTPLLCFWVLNEVRITAKQLGIISFTIKNSEYQII